MPTRPPALNCRSIAFAERRLLNHGPESPGQTPEIGTLEKLVLLPEDRNRELLSPIVASNRSKRQWQEASQRHYESLGEPQLLNALAKLHENQQRLVRSLSDPGLAARNPTFFASHQSELLEYSHELEAARQVWADKQGLSKMPLPDLVEKNRAAQSDFQQQHAAYFAKYGELDAKPWTVADGDKTEFENQRMQLCCLTEQCVAMAVVVEKRQQKDGRRTSQR